MHSKCLVSVAVLFSVLVLTGCDMWHTQHLTLERVIEGEVVPTRLSASEIEQVFSIAENIAKNHDMLRGRGEECNRTPCARFSRELVHLDLTEGDGTVDIKISAFYAPRSDFDPRALARTLKKDLEKNLTEIVVTVSN